MAKKRTLSQLIRQEYEQKLLFNTDTYTDYSPDWAVESCSGADYKTAAPEQKAVLEQPPIPPALIQKHWLETYCPSKRKAYYYYRYVWMEGRQLKHKHLPGGNTKSDHAIALKEKVEEAIALGKSPQEIIALIALAARRTSS